MVSIGERLFAAVFTFAFCWGNYLLVVMQWQIGPVLHDQTIRAGGVERDRRSAVAVG